MNAIKLYRIMRFLYLHKIPFLPKLIQLLIFLIYNSKVTGDSVIGKGTYFVCKGISTVLIPGTVIGDNCVLGLRFSTVRQFPYKNVPIIGNNVWIGPNVIVAGPVIIEDDVIIVSGSYVTKSVPRGAIVSGNPAKIVGWRKNLEYEINVNPKYKDGVMPFLIERSSENISDFKSDIDNSSKIIDIISECLEIPKGSLSGNERIEDIAEWDSLKNMMIIGRLEKEYNISIPTTDLMNLVSIQAFIDEIKKLCISLDNKAESNYLMNELNSFNIDNSYFSPLLMDIVHQAKSNPNKIAIIAKKEQVSYAELILNVRKTASYMSKLGLKAKDKIILSGQKDIEFIYIYLASHLLGVVNVIVDSNSNKKRLEYIETVVSPKVCFGYISEKITSIPMDDLRIYNYEPYKFCDLDVSSDDVSEILFTTGTTGVPKGVCLTYKNIYGSATNINKYIKNEEKDVEIVALPICHSFGLGRVRCNLLKGATMILINGFTNVAQFFEDIEKNKVTGFGIVPAAWSYLIKMSGEKISQYASQIRYIEIGSAAMPLETKKQILRMFPNTRICMHYGSTEASRSCFIEFHDIKHLDSIGKPVTDDVDIKIFDKEGNEVLDGEKGEICIKGNMVMPYYLDRIHTADSFYGDYFRSGDYGYKSKDGYFYLLGREKEMINVGGKKVSPYEVEDIVCSLGVGDCVCVPAVDPDGLLGEVVKCYVLKDSTNLTFKQIADRLQDKLEPYKRPVFYEWIDEIPKTSSGKKQRINLK